VDIEPSPHRCRYAADPVDVDVQSDRSAFTRLAPPPPPVGGPAWASSARSAPGCRVVAANSGFPFTIGRRYGPPTASGMSRRWRALWCGVSA